MKIATISVDAWSTGRISVSLDNDDSVYIALTEDESERFRQLAADIFFSRQKAIAKEIETARPLMIELKPAYKDPDDDIPF